MAEVWLTIAIAIWVLLAGLITISIFQKRCKPSDLPPGPTSIPFISTFHWLRKSTSEIRTIVRSLKPKLGRIITVHVFPSRPFIYIFSHSLAHKALIQNGAVFADRPTSLPTARLFNNNQRTITSAGYGDTWRILKRNLTSHILHPNGINQFSTARSWVLQTLITRLRDQSQDDTLSPVKVVDHFRYSMFCLLVFMCFGERLDDEQIKEIQVVHHQLLLSFTSFQILNFHPWITRLVFRRRWKKLYDLKNSRNNIVIPLIKARKKLSQLNQNHTDVYVDSLLKLELPEEEIVALCSEFLNAGTDTTTTSLQWIMANLVKHQHIQTKLFNEILQVVGPHSHSSQIKEEDLPKMKYLKAVVLEGLRRHPPTDVLLPHAVTQPMVLDGYVIPTNAVVNFMVVDMGRDPQVWEEPMEFKPERFLGLDDFDLLGTREIKMIPFGVGRRMCPGLNLALLHLEYFVANLVWEFEWKEVDGYKINLDEKFDFTMVMSHPLHARITSRLRP